LQTSSTTIGAWNRRTGCSILDKEFINCGHGRFNRIIGSWQRRWDTPICGWLIEKRKVLIEIICGSLGGCFGLLKIGIPINLKIWDFGVLKVERFLRVDRL
jgi:hypothetical protein